MRALELKGDLPQLVDPRYQLGINVSDWTEIEYRWLRRERAYQVAGNLVALAANFGKIVMQVAVTNAMLSVFDEIQLSNPSAATVTYRYGLLNVAGYIAGSNSITRDTRNFNSSQGTFSQVVNNVTQDLANAVYPQLSVQAGDTVVIRPQIVLTPKSQFPPTPMCFIVETNVVNQPLNVNVIYHERVALVPELT